MKKTMKKLLPLLLAVVMSLAFAGAALADTVTQTPATGTITITPPDNATGPNTYKIYKVFDATVGENGAVAYKLLDGVTVAPDGFTAENGYITAAPANLDAAAPVLANYSGKRLVATLEATGAAAVTSEQLTPGYYYIETTTGTAVIVEAGADVQVQDKNTITTVKKSAGTEYDAASLKAIAAVGTDQPFTAVVTKGKGAKTVVFTDTMTNLTYNGDVVVTVGGNAVAPSASINTSAENETFTVTGAEGDSSFTIAFDDDYIASLADGTEITLNYTGKVTSAALNTNPAENKATVTSGNGATNTSESEIVKVYNATIRVNKVDKSSDNAPLAGAKFKLKNADNKFYAGASTDGTANWTDDGIEVEAQAVYGEDGETVVSYTAMFEGLDDGAYTLIESTVPGGYNKAANQTITIQDGVYTSVNLLQEATVENSKGAVLPSTGGIGTTIFYIAGSALVLVAGAALFARRVARKQS